MTTATKPTAQPTTPHTATRLPMYYENIAGHHCVFDADGDQVCTVATQGRAETIVQRVNAFEGLVAALRDEIDAITVWQNAIHPRSDVQEGFAISLSKLRSALKLAGKGE